MKKIFIVNGKPGAGKDTFASILNKLHCDRVYKYSSVTKVKEIATLCGWDGKKEEKDRKFLSDLKILTSKYNDMSFRDIEEEIEFFKNHKRYEIMLIDIREPEEIERAVKEFGAETIFIDSNRVPHITSNPADANVENYIYDHVIYNNGTLLEFTRNIKEFLDGFRLI